MDAFDRIADLILFMGDYASTMQSDIVRTYKEDGSVLTETDLTINNQVCSLLMQLFPTANIITEEALSPYRPDAPLTFILDPIDGTDVYSQGLPGWCVALGILDMDNTCVGAMIYAPRWGLGGNEGLFFRQDPHADLLLNNTFFTPRIGNGRCEQIAIASYAHRHLHLERFGGKLRCYGSNILHMISPLIYPHIQGAISVPCYAWDMAAAHALLARQGLVVRYADGSPFTYTPSLLKERKPFSGIVFSGTQEAVDYMASSLI